MKRIYKYKLGIDGESITIRDNFYQILTIQSQDGWPHVWIELDDSCMPTTVTFVSVGTGWEMPESDLVYAGTAQDANGFVWHYYYRIEENDNV